MNIILITTSFPESVDEPIISGEHKNPYYLGKTLSERGHKVTVLKHWGNQDDYEIHGIRVITIGEGEGKGFVRSFTRSVRQIPAAREILKQEEIDIIHSHVLSTSIGLIFLRNHGYIETPIISTAHGTSVPEIKANLGNMDTKEMLYYVNAHAQKYLDTYAWTRSDVAISVSEFQLEEMQDVYDVPREKVVAITNGVDTDHYAPELADHIRDRYDLQDSYVILFVGRMVRKKGIDVMVEAAPDIVKAHPETEFLIVGGSEEYARHGNEIIRAIRNSNLSNKFTVLQSVPESELPDYYNAADVAVVPSRGYESIPTVVFEAMACGLPVVGTNKWGIPHQLGYTNTLIPEDDNNALSGKLTGILDNPTERENLGKRNRERAVNKFDWNVIVKAHEQLYEESKQ